MGIMLIIVHKLCLIVDMFYELLHNMALTTTYFSFTEPKGMKHFSKHNKMKSSLRPHNAIFMCFQHWQVDKHCNKFVFNVYPASKRCSSCLLNKNNCLGRNELIARYIKLRTGKMRSRKQVSSHIQVMARRKSKEIQAQLKVWRNPRVTQKDQHNWNEVIDFNLISIRRFISN